MALEALTSAALAGFASLLREQTPRDQGDGGAMGAPKVSKNSPGTTIDGQVDERPRNVPTQNTSQTRGADHSPRLPSLAVESHAHDTLLVVQIAHKAQSRSTMTAQLEYMKHHWKSSWSESQRNVPVAQFLSASRASNSRLRQKRRCLQIFSQAWSCWRPQLRRGQHRHEFLNEVLMQNLHPIRNLAGVRSCRVSWKIVGAKVPLRSISCAILCS